MSKEENAISEFRSLINDYKRPYIENTLESDEYSQDTSKLNDILSKFDELYTVLFYEIVPGRDYQGSKIDANTRGLIVRSFMVRGGLDYMKDHPESRQLFKHYLDLDLKRFPFTLKLKHIDTFVNDNIEPNHGKIIPNEESDES